MKRKNTKRLIIHHSASQRDTTTVKQVRSWHKEKGFTDAKGHSGYHYFILADGSIVHDRPEDEVGCQVKNANHNSIGICVMGNFNFQIPSEKQIKSLETLCAMLCRKYDLKYWNIYGHRDIKWLFIFSTTQTACPGDTLYSQLKPLRQKVAAILSGKHA